MGHKFKLNSVEPTEALDNKRGFLYLMRRKGRPRLSTKEHIIRILQKWLAESYGFKLPRKTRKRYERTKLSPQASLIAGIKSESDNTLESLHQRLDSFAEPFLQQVETAIKENTGPVIVIQLTEQQFERVEIVNKDKLLPESIPNIARAIIWLSDPECKEVIKAYRSFPQTKRVMFTNILKACIKVGYFVKKDVHRIFETFQERLTCCGYPVDKNRLVKLKEKWFERINSYYKKLE